jgi:hypothetical protein
VIVTEPFPGSDDIPKPWDGQPPAHYRTEWDITAEPVYLQDDDDDDEPGGGPPGGPNRRMLAGIVAAIVVVVAGGVALWWFAPSSGGAHATPRPAITTSSPPTIGIRHRPPPSAGQPTSAGRTNASPDNAAAYDVGTCFDEQFGSAAGNVQLNPVPCGGADSVFVINAVVPSATACDSGPGSADYHDHGYEVPDDTAGVTYCASLVVPVNSCFVNGPGKPIARAVCGSSPDVVQVQAIESASAAASACTDRTNPDVWFYQAPNSGQYACVSRPAAGGTAPTSSG